MEHLKLKKLAALALAGVMSLSVVGINIPVTVSADDNGEVYVYGLGNNKDDKKDKNKDNNGNAYGKDKKAKNKHEKKEKKSKSKDSSVEWNMQMINADNNNTEVNGEKVKVAVIDSGIDYTSDIDVYSRKNFVPGQDDVSILYEDISGHGTSIAGIISAKDNDEGITGINPNVELYSAKVLDANLQAPVSRIAEAIYWAIDNEVDIITMSFGTTTDSEVLREAVKAADEAGILIIAAAGNSGTVEYPAAYDEVLAVGSVDSHGDVSEGSAIGEEVELVAPGEQILSTGAFGGIAVFSGTSMAAPHVAGVASVLWEKDLNVSADFIRYLLDNTANLYGDANQYGYGLVDLEYALSQYDYLKELYEAEKVANEEGIAFYSSNAEDNENAVDVFDDVDYVEGSWASTKHEELAGQISAVSGNPLSAAGMAIVKLGAIAPDKIIAGMTEFPEWHGFTSYQLGGKYVYTSNYISAYIYLTEVASAVNSGSNGVSVTPNVYMASEPLNGIQSHIYSNGIYGQKKTSDGEIEKRVYTWSELLESNTVNNRNKALFIYGMALHTATDTFAHSTRNSAGEFINHPNADKYDYEAGRFECAKVMAQNIIAHIKRFEFGSIQDYYNVAYYYKNSEYNNTFKLVHFNTFVKQVDEAFYNTNSSIFNNISD